ncbi:MAG: vitamin B12-dependent ribonucleotide reductase, partial [Chloroflexi bacterium]|nr:vitamin B12-dependent ribonucleotide reductase [Chloroflexota bacterium]
MVLPAQKTSTLIDGAQTRIQRYFTTPGRHPYDEVEWEQRSASITDESGNAFFEQNDVEVPAFWSQTATNVVVSKYFRGMMDTERRETSTRQMISRVVDEITGWGREGNYFTSQEEEEA